jgi:hypothetical protein
MSRMSAHSRALRSLAEEARLLEVRDAAQTDPKALIAEINAFDPTTLEHFRFTMFPSTDDPLWPYRKSRADDGWLFQAATVDWLMGNEHPLFALFEEWSPNWQYDPDARVFLILKARQLGITWIAMAIELWHLLFRPGSHCVAYSYNEEQSKKLIARAWLMYNSLPEVLRAHVEVITPSRHDEPSEWIKVKHLDSGLISTIQSLPATKKAGHGDTITFGLMDEAAYQDYCKQIFTACLPATQRGNARLAVVSTANGVGNPETEEGNFFNVLYQTRRARGLSFVFMPWHAAPTRDEKWYARHAMALGEVERNQPVPAQRERRLHAFGSAVLRPRRAGVLPATPCASTSSRAVQCRRASESSTAMKLRDGLIDVWEMPVPGRKYALAVDTSTGKAMTTPHAGVFDLETGAIVAELHAKIELHAHTPGLLPRQVVQQREDRVERQGGYGDALITLLREGSRGLPALLEPLPPHRLRQGQEAHLGRVRPADGPEGAPR